MEHAEEAVADLSTLPDQTLAMGDERAQFPDLLRRDPDRGDEFGCQESSQGESVSGIGLDPS